MNKNKDNLSMQQLLTIPVEVPEEGIKPAETWEDENWFNENIIDNDLPLDDNSNSPIRGLVKFPEDLTVRETEVKMNSIHAATSIKDLRESDHIGISIPVTKVLKWFTTNKKKN